MDLVERKYIKYRQSHDVKLICHYCIEFSIGVGRYYLKIVYLCALDISKIGNN
jgi:hypothetical protein